MPTNTQSRLALSHLAPDAVQSEIRAMSIACALTFAIWSGDMARN